MLAALRRLTGYHRTTATIARIARENDGFRRRPYATPNGRVLFTPGVMALAGLDGSASGLAGAMFTQGQVLLLIADAFPDATFDPTSERDAGTVEYRGHTIVFRITYHDLDFLGAALDPSDKSRTGRIMTIALAGEVSPYG